MLMTSQIAEYFLVTLFVESEWIRHSIEILIISQNNTFRRFESSHILRFLHPKLLRFKMQYYSYLNDIKFKWVLNKNVTEININQGNKSDFLKVHLFIVEGITFKTSY